MTNVIQLIVSIGIAGLLIGELPSQTTALEEAKIKSFPSRMQTTTQHQVDYSKLTQTTTKTTFHKSKVLQTNSHTTHQTVEISPSRPISTPILSSYLPSTLSSVVPLSFIYSSNNKSHKQNIDESSKIISDNSSTGIHDKKKFNKLLNQYRASDTSHANANANGTGNDTINKFNGASTQINDKLLKSKSNNHKVKSTDTTLSSKSSLVVSNDNHYSSDEKTLTGKHIMLSEAPVISPNDETINAIKEPKILPPNNDRINILLTEHNKNQTNYSPVTMDAFDIIKNSTSLTISPKQNSSEFLNLNATRSPIDIFMYDENSIECPRTLSKQIQPRSSRCNMNSSNINNSNTYDNNHATIISPKKPFSGNASNSSLSIVSASVVMASGKHVKSPSENPFYFSGNQPTQITNENNIASIDIKAFEAVNMENQTLENDTFLQKNHLNTNIEQHQNNTHKQNVTMNSVGLLQCMSMIQLHVNISKINMSSNYVTNINCSSMNNVIDRNYTTTTLTLNSTLKEKYSKIQLKAKKPQYASTVVHEKHVTKQNDQIIESKLYKTYEIFESNESNSTPTTIGTSMSRYNVNETRLFDKPTPILIIEVNKVAKNVSNNKLPSVNLKNFLISKKLKRSHNSKTHEIDNLNLTTNSFKLFENSSNSNTSNKISSTIIKNQVNSTFIPLDTENVWNKMQTHENVESIPIITNFQSNENVNDKISTSESNVLSIKNHNKHDEQITSNPSVFNATMLSNLSKEMLTNETIAFTQLPNINWLSINSSNKNERSSVDNSEQQNSNFLNGINATQKINNKYIMSGSKMVNNIHHIDNMQSNQVNNKPTKSIDEPHQNVSNDVDSVKTSNKLFENSLYVLPSYSSYRNDDHAEDENYVNGFLRAAITSNKQEFHNHQFAIDYSNGTNENANNSQSNETFTTWPVKHAAIVEGDVVLGGLMMVHSREDTITCGSIMAQGGIQSLEVMLYTLDRINEIGLLPNFTLGAHILDDCDKDTYGLEMAVDFIKGK